MSDETPPDAEAQPPMGEETKIKDVPIAEAPVITEATETATTADETSTPEPAAPQGASVTDGGEAADGEVEETKENAMDDGYDDEDDDSEEDGDEDDGPKAQPAAPVVLPSALGRSRARSGLPSLFIPEAGSTKPPDLQVLIGGKGSVPPAPMDPAKTKAEAEAEARSQTVAAAQAKAKAEAAERAKAEEAHKKAAADAEVLVQAPAAPAPTVSKEAFEETRMAPSVPPSVSVPFPPSLPSTPPTAFRRNTPSMTTTVQPDGGPAAVEAAARQAMQTPSSGYSQSERVSRVADVGPFPSDAPPPDLELPPAPPPAQPQPAQPQPAQQIQIPPPAPQASPRARFSTWWKSPIAQWLIVVMCVVGVVTGVIFYRTTWAPLVNKLGSADGATCEPVTAENLQAFIGQQDPTQFVDIGAAKPGQAYVDATGAGLVPSGMRPVYDLTSKPGVKVCQPDGSCEPVTAENLRTLIGQQDPTHYVDIGAAKPGQAYVDATGVGLVPSGMRPVYDLLAKPGVKVCH